MELSFSTTHLRDICEKRAAAIIALGSAAALELHERLADFDAAETAADLSLLYPDLIESRSTNEKVLRLSNGANLIFQAGGATKPMKSDGSTDWNSVKRVMIHALELQNG